jgi:hypothetical protein
MDPHLIHVPRLASLAARGLSGGDFEGAGGQAHGAFDAQVLGFSALEQLGAYFLQGANFAAGKRDADLVDFLAGEEC